MRSKEVDWILIRALIFWIYVPKQKFGSEKDIIAYLQTGLGIDIMGVLKEVKKLGHTWASYWRIQWYFGRW